MPARILHVDLDAFFVEVCRQRHPELRGIELLVVGGRRDQRGVVQSASYAARSFGIHAGMPIAEAVRLCPQATFFQGAFAHYRDASRAVRLVLDEFSPTVVMSSLDEAYLDFAGTERLHPVSLLPIAEQLRDRVQWETGLDCSVGIGPNRMIAKLASDCAKPRGTDGSPERLGTGIPRRVCRCGPCRAWDPRRRSAGPSSAWSRCIRYRRWRSGPWSGSSAPMRGHSSSGRRDKEEPP